MSDGDRFSELAQIEIDLTIATVAHVNADHSSRRERHRSESAIRIAAGVGLAAMIVAVALVVLRPLAAGKGHSQGRVSSAAPRLHVDPVDRIPTGNGPPGHDLRLSADPFNGIGSQINIDSLTGLPGGLPLPATSLVNQNTMASAWTRHWSDDNGIEHISVVVEYPSVAIRVIAESPSEVTDPGKTFQAIAEQDGQPSAYQTIGGLPALVGTGVDVDVGEPISGVEVVIGQTHVTIQGYTSTDDLVAVANSLLPASK